MDADIIISHYRKVERKKLRPIEIPQDAVLSSVCHGLGDSVMLTDLPKASGGKRQSYSPSEHFRWLSKRNPYWKDVDCKPILVNAPDLVRRVDCGNGHYIQRIRRAFGCPVDKVPKGFIHWKGQRYRSRVVMHFDPGIHAVWQRQNIHPQARIMSSQTKNELVRFIDRHPEMDFVEIGNKPLRLRGTRYATNQTTNELIESIAQASWFIGIMSGPMHVATALNLRCIVIINFPEAENILLPTLAVTGQVEEEWFYPQNVHLHQEGDGPLVRRVTADNLDRAMDGKIYPYWSDAFCDMINEKL